MAHTSGWVAAGVGAGLILGAANGFAADEPRGWNGHLGFGYAKVFVTDRDIRAVKPRFSPGGSLSVGGGMDYPVARNLRAGIDVGYHLLGGRTIERGSLLASVDYSVFEAIAFLHWHPAHAGPLGRVSAGPVLMSTRAELSTSGGGAAFGDLAVEEVALGWAVDATLMSSRPAPVRPSFQVGMRVGFLDDQNWHLVTARLGVHF